MTIGLSLIGMFALGYVLATIQKGVTVTINHQHEEQPAEFNESLAGMLPPEVQQYYAKTNGHNDF